MPLHVRSDPCETKVLALFMWCSSADKVLILTERINIPFVWGDHCQAMLPLGKLFVPKVSHVDTGSFSCHLHIVGDLIQSNLHMLNLISR